MARPEIENLEKLICELPDVRAARIAVGANGQPSEIHVLSNKGKPPKYLARDIVTMAMAEANLQLDYRIVSIVELDSSPHQAATAQDDRNKEAAKRVSVASVELDDKQASVALKEGSNTASYSTEVADGDSVRAVATATLGALRQLESNATRADIETATIADINDRKVAVVTIVAINDENKELVFSGSAIVRNSESDAVARAVLDATNRRIGQL